MYANLRKRVPYFCRFYCRAQTEEEFGMSVIDVGKSRANIHDKMYILSGKETEKYLNV
jgi:hypothetical protein